jgi:uncharacterized protein (DUF305 family)
MRARTLVITVSTVALASVLAACGTSSSTTTSSPSMPASADAMTKGSADDIAFAQLMIPHHQQAVEMADLALAHATSPDVKALATQIKAAQGPEITTMSGWLTAWGQPTSMPTSSDMDGMDMGGMSESGMMSDQDMSALAAATGTAFDRMWLQMMIAHHQGAVGMADQVVAHGANAEVKKLAQSVIDGQTAEIVTMKKLLSST